MASMVDVDDTLTNGDTSADVAYRWTIRVLYTVAIALNVYMLLDTVADEAQVAQWKAQAKGIGDRILRPLHIDRAVKRGTGSVLWEAEEIVLAAQEGTE